MLRIVHVTKSFGATRAVDDVSLHLSPGEITGLLGENGAGKTTLMRIVAGEIAPESGTIETPRRVGMVHQHFAIVPHFTIAENLALVRDRGFRFATQKTLQREAEEMVRASGIELPDVTRRAEELSVGERAKLELIKAVASGPELLILDEPTSVLTPLESEELFALIRRLSATVVFITHKIPEVLQVAKRFVVMRRGKVVLDTRETMSAEELAGAMIGVAARFSASDGALKRAAPRIRAIVGVAGNGQRELAERTRAEAEGRVGFIPEDRTRDALIAEMTIAENIGLAARRWRPAEARRRAESLMALYKIRSRSPAQLAGEL
ncbi:MAG TPA: ATP-binding cassette domain-containing protein, partial [Thermoanaerobaculia bacterium]|nr:ATP-binding cassette domain-containing protein [Thermoanaerobaculia bacterium]